MKNAALLYAILSLLGQSTSFTAAADDGAFFLSAEATNEGIVKLEGPWKYHSGDKKSWADQKFDDKSWELADPLLPQGGMPESGWKGIGWFRLNIDVDPGLVNKSLGIFLSEAGNSKVYLDGKLILPSAGPGSFAEIRFSTEGIHTLAIRLENQAVDYFHFAEFYAGFAAYIGDLQTVVDSVRSEARINTGFQMFFTALPLAFALLHFILFIYIRDSRANLYYALLMLFWSAGVFFDYQVMFAENMTQLLTFLRLHRGTMAIVPIVGLRFIYSVFRSKLPRQFWILSLVVLIAGTTAVLKPESIYFQILSIVSVALVVEQIRVVTGAVKEKREGAWFFVTGYFFVLLFGAYDFLMDLNLISGFAGVPNAYFFGQVGFFACMSAYLARDFARTNRRILEHERRASEQEIRRRILEADNERKTTELEEARKLQLSMLPKSLPEMPNLEIAVFMETATEVGGDYYDFHLARDGSLTVAIGDAIGHGMKAGIMVATMKSLFTALGGESEIPLFLNHTNRIINRMKMVNMYMAVQLLNIRDSKMSFSAAAMPPILIYRAKTKQVEEYLIEGLLLGTDLKFNYQLMEVELLQGDTILLMTDGLPESLNESDDMFGYTRVKELFAEAGNLPADAIIEFLVSAGVKWRAGRQQDDDITLLVLRLKQ